MAQINQLLCISNLHIDSSTQKILQGVSLSIAHGETLGLVGESGSGKSMTAQGIMRLLNPSLSITSGEILFDNEPLHLKTRQQMQKIRGKKIGMIFQDPMTSLNPTMPVGLQIAESLLFHEKLSKRQAYEQTIELLNLVGIAEPTIRYQAYPFHLSGGMRQRIMIAMALSAKPMLLIADEPTTALDATVQAQILDLLKRIQSQLGMAMLLITHDLNVVERTCDRVAVMQLGTIVETASVQKLLHFPQHPYTKKLLASRCHL